MVGAPGIFKVILFINKTLDKTGKLSSISLKFYNSGNKYNILLFEIEN